MATTTNFGWETPDDTDLVKDGALAIRTLGSAIDTSLVDLKGGTTGQVLAKASNTDMDFTWSSVDPLTILDAKADLITATAADTPARLAVGTNGQVLTADSTTSTGLKWATPSSGAVTLISRTSFSNVASQAFDNIFTSTYKAYLMVIENIGAATFNDDLQLQFRYAGPTTQTASYYGNATKTTSAGTSTQVSFANTSEITISQDASDTTYKSFGQFYIYSVGNSASDRPYITGSFVDAYNPNGYTNWGGTIQARNYTGVLLKSASTNITGTVAFYGLATA